MIEPYIQRITTTTNSGTAVDVRLPRVLAGQLLRLSHVALYNASGEAVTVQFGVIDIVGFAPLLGEDAIADGDAAGHYLPLLVGEQTRFTARVTGTSLAGTVTLVACGELLMADPPAQAAQNG